jgi:hypothetical protein
MLFGWKARHPNIKKIKVKTRLTLTKGKNYHDNHLDPELFKVFKGKKLKKHYQWFVKNMICLKR